MSRAKTTISTFLVLLVAVAGLVPYPTAAQELSREETIKEGQAAAKAGDFNKVYQLGLPFALKGDGEFEFGLAGVLLFYAEGMKINGVADQDHRHIGMIWLRRAAAHGWDAALEELALFYRWGEKGLPRDVELSDCFTQAESDHKAVARCLTREHAKGYDQ